MVTTCTPLPDSAGWEPNEAAAVSWETPLLAYQYLYTVIDASWGVQADPVFVAGQPPSFRSGQFLIDPFTRFDDDDYHKNRTALFKRPLDVLFFRNVRLFFEEAGLLPGQMADFLFPSVSLNRDAFWRARLELSPYAFADGVARTEQLYSIDAYLLPHTPNPFGDLGYPDAFLEAVLRMPSGVFLVGGMSRSGRTTTQTSLIMELARRQGGLQVATLESPVEFVIQPYSLEKPSRVTQISVPPTRVAWNDAFLSILKRQFNLLGVSQAFTPLPDGTTVDLSGRIMEAAANGARVFATLQARDFFEAFDNFTYRKDPLERRAARELAIRHLGGIMVQQLVSLQDEVVLHCGCMVFTEPLRESLTRDLNRGDDAMIQRTLSQFSRDDSSHGCLSFVTSQAKLQSEKGVDPSLLLLGTGLSLG